jgi:hypothetical protein
VGSHVALLAILLCVACAHAGAKATPTAAAGTGGVTVIIADGFDPVDVKIDDVPHTLHPGRAHLALPTGGHNMVFAQSNLQFFTATGCEPLIHIVGGARADVKDDACASKKYRMPDVPAIDEPAATASHEEIAAWLGRCAERSQTIADTLVLGYRAATAQNDYQHAQAYNLAVQQIDGARRELLQQIELLPRAPDDATWQRERLVGAADCRLADRLFDDARHGKLEPPPPRYIDDYDE